MIFVFMCAANFGKNTSTVMKVCIRDMRNRIYVAVISEYYICILLLIIILVIEKNI